jgi:ribosomal protein L13
MMRSGPRPAFKGAMKGMLRAREAGAEAVERLQDVYAEAESEHAAETLEEDD